VRRFHQQLLRYRPLWVISLPSAVRAQCDKLIVALNADASVRAPKGPTRPINPLEKRAEIIAAIRYVDRVLAFEECTQLEVLRCLVPGVLIKGADYAEEPGAPVRSMSLLGRWSELRTRPCV
jgi:bifunctional ADP-heptose synthase (sugar kinase/adenylyltransferase)